MSEIKITYAKVADLIPYAANSRTHSDAQVAQIAASIKEFGWTNPVLVDGSNTIIAGHGRLMAARKLGMDEVPVIVLDHLSKAQQRALVIADNQLALNAGWDMDLLAAEIEGLNFEGFDLELLGFEDKELNKLLGELSEPEIKDKEIPEEMQNQMLLSFPDEQTMQEWYQKAEDAGIVCKIL
jgi:ParB-like chromosome segregation protein Spo0J